MIVGILLLVMCLSVAISIVLVTAFGKRDASAKLWFAGFALDGLSPAFMYLAIAHGFAAGPSIGTLTHFGAALIFGESLRRLKGDTSGPRLAAVALGLSAVWLGSTFITRFGEPADRALLNAIASALAYVWATWWAWQLCRARSSIYVKQLLVLFGLGGLIWVGRAVHVFATGSGMMLGEGDPAGVIALPMLATLSLARVFSYLGLRLDELRRSAEREARAVREQSYALGRRNAEIASAMYSVPGCCLVTDASLRVVYANAEASRLLGIDLQTSRPRLDTLLIGTAGASFGDLVRRQTVQVKAADSGEVMTMALSAKVTEDEGAAVQYVFLLQPAS